MLVEVWSDVVCPWCYVGKRRFERALADFPDRGQVQVVHRSFQLDPSRPAGVTQSRGEVLGRKYGWSEAQVTARQAQMRDTAAAEGLDFKLGNALTGNTAEAHQLIHLGQALGIQDAVVERLYRGYFTEGRSLFDRDSLVALAAEAGLDPDEARAVLVEGRYATAVTADGQEAHALGATGVPFFVIARRFGISGAQPTPVFAEVLAKAWAETGQKDVEARL
ncbi:MAG TPA: DsbA family oxidoreductase [Polyangia bacterium]|jgi:predicted DsbA family dithiol-disulfide isomerase|nr:DsbA family oxidoreductase [Polyangia bacterium]